MLGDSTSQIQSGAGEVRRLVGDGGETLASPAGQVGHQDVATEVQLRLEENPPAAGTALASLERRVEVARQDAGRHRMPGRGTRTGVELAIDDLGNKKVRDLEEILVGCGPSDGRRHLL